MTAPAIEGVSHNSANGASSCTQSFTTGHDADVVYFGISTEVASGGAPAVTGIATVGLTYAKHGSVAQSGAASPFGGTNDLNLEVWSVAVPTAGTYTAVVSVASSANIFVDMIRVTNVVVFDTARTGSSAGGGVSSSATINYTTGQAEDLLLLFSAATDNQYSAPTGWAGADGVWAAGGVNFVCFSKTNSARETSSVTISMGSRFGVFPGFAGILIASAPSSQSYVSINGS